MSDPGYLPSAYEQPPEHPGGSDIPLWLIVTLVLVLIAGGGLTAVAVAGLDLGGDEKSYPRQWDPRIAPYVKIVEEKRELRFMHPVEVRFLPKAAFEKTVTSDEDDLDKEDRKELDQAAGLFRAIGLVTGDVDLFKAFNDASGGGTLAYYSFADERITIRGERLTPASKVTLVHELTHALQDQHFDLGKRTRALEKESEESDRDTTEDDVLDAITEGDAERVATLYRESLTAKQRKIVARDERAQADQASKGVKGVPKVVLTIISAPYVLGEAVLKAVVADGGNDAVDDLFRDTPAHDSALLDPFQILTGKTGAAKVPAPKLRSGEEKIDAGEFGAAFTYFMLAERLPLVDALEAADGWGGDGYVAFERAGRTCVRTSYAGDDDEDTARLRGALRRWIAAAPGSPAKVSAAEGRVLFESCDPGTKAKVGKDASEDALRLATVRTYLGAAVLEGGADSAAARCFAARMVREFSVAELTSTSKPNSATTDRMRRIAIGCR